MFEDYYKCTHKLNIESVFSLFNLNIEAGVYNNGVIHVFHVNEDVLDEIPFLKNNKNDYIPLMSTGLGDLFYFDKLNGGIFYLNPQGEAPSYITNNMNEFLHKFLTDFSIQESVIWNEGIEMLIEEYRGLNYKEMFILKPLQILGGFEDISNYSIVELSVYLNIVSQIRE